MNTRRLMTAIFPGAAPRCLTVVATTWVVALLIASPAFAGGDDAVAARAKLALVEGRLRDAENVTVTSFNGEVDLEGIVHSERARREAARLLVGLPGVAAVQNDLVVRGHTDQVDSDEVISRRVRKAFVEAGVAGGSEFEIRTFNGEVDLSGIVGSDSERATATRIAGEVPGVNAVRNGLLIR
jgi:osmotically-inducible protein OsmY